jgi:hypothetical protein
MIDPTPIRAPALCWICKTNPADSGEHIFKASDVRARTRGISQRAPIRLHEGVKRIGNERINIRVGAVKSDQLKFAQSICQYCNNTRTAPYDRAWERLSEYLTANWATIRESGRFNLKRPFPRDTQALAIDVHLYFVKMFGCKLCEEDTALDLRPFARALMTRQPHPEIGLLIAEAPPALASHSVLGWNSDVHPRMEMNTGSIHGATWVYLTMPFAVKVIYIRAGIPLRPPAGIVWYPTKTRRIVALSPYDGTVSGSGVTG